MTRKILLTSCLAFLVCGCGTEHRAPEPFSKLAEEFVYTTLSWSPVSATQFGYHQHGNVRLDSTLDDFSSATLEEHRRWLTDYRLRLMQSVRPEQLSPEDRADYEIIQDQISLNLLELTSIQAYRHNPTIYVELIGNGLYSPYVLEYASKHERCEHILGRLRAVPPLLDQARRNLASAPEVWTRVAGEENDGNVGLIDGVLKQQCAPEVGADTYETAAKAAIAELRGFNQWLQNELSGSRYDWRLGPEAYAQKFRYVLETDDSPENVLRAAEQNLRDTRRQMFAIASGMTGVDPHASETEVIRRALDVLAAKHGTRESYFEDARRDLAEARDFVRQKDLLTLPPRENLQVIETPEFMRGIYAVGGFNSAPVLEPQLGAFYWITPMPPQWPADRIESKLREYNTYGLQILTIHEAMPGHYVQAEYANEVQPPLRRILRGVFANGPYVEGWAVYVTEVMIDSGYMNNDPGLRLTFLKHQLRVISNAILDIRLQTMGMSDADALRLMIDGAFQEREEAVEKLQRAQLSSTQLPMYFVGFRDWNRARDQYRSAHGGLLSLKEFHQRALAEGAVPMPVLGRLISSPNEAN